MQRDVCSNAIDVNCRNIQCSAEEMALISHILFSLGFTVKSWCCLKEKYSPAAAGVRWGIPWGTWGTPVNCWANT